MSNNISKPIRILHTSFNLPIHPREIKQWRGAFIEMAGWENDLFHNHVTPDTFHYRYPLIQYRIHRDQAALYTINEGVEAFQKVLASTDWKIHWEGSQRSMLIDELKMDECTLQMLPEPKTYTLHKYLPFNQDNYQRWQATSGMIDRITILEEVLVGHILCLATAMDYQLPERLEVKLQNIQNMRCLHYKAPMLAFDLEFTANILLPFGVGLGKSVSHGYGQCRPQRVYRSRVKGRQRSHPVEAPLKKI